MASSDTVGEVEETIKKIRQFNDMEKLLFQKEVETRKNVNNEISQIAQLMAQQQVQNQKKPTDKQKAQKTIDTFKQEGMNREKTPKFVTPEMTQEALDATRQQILNPEPRIPIRSGETATPVQPAPPVMDDQTLDAIQKVEELTKRPEATQLEGIGFQESDQGPVVDEDILPEQMDVEDLDSPFTQQINRIIANAEEIGRGSQAQQNAGGQNQDQLILEAIQGVQGPKGIGTDEALAGAVFALAPTVLGALFGQPTSTVAETSKYGVKAADDFLKSRDDRAKAVSDSSKERAELLIKQREQQRKEAQKAAEIQIDSRKTDLLERVFNTKIRKDQRDAIQQMLEAGWKENTFHIAEQQIDRDYQKAWLAAQMKTWGGGKNRKPPDKLLEAIANAPAIERIMEQLDFSVSAYANKFGPIRGNIAAINPWDEIGQTIESQVRSLRQFIGKMREGGVLRAEDERKYKAMLPGMGDTPEAFRRKMNAVRNTWFEMMAVKRRVWEKAGVSPDVFDEAGISSGFSPIETGLEPTAGEPGKGLRPAPSPQQVRQGQTGKKTPSLDSAIKKRKEQLRSTQGK